IRFNVPDAPAPITVTLFTEAFEKAGDSPDAVAEFYVIDQLGNRAQSPEQTLDIHLSRPLELPAPTVRGQTGNNFSPTQPEIRVLVPKGSLLPGDKLTVHWQGASAVADGSYTSPQRLVSAGLEIAVPRSVLAYSLGKFVTVTYIIERNGVSTTSLPLTLNILKLPDSALIPPKILEANASNVLDVVALGSKAAIVHALLWTLIEAGQQVWMSLEGKKADGTAHNLTVWNGSDSKVNATWVNQGFWPYTLANSYLKQLGDRSTLTIKFKASLDKSNNAATATVFPDRFYTIRAEVDTWKDSVTDFANGTTGNWTIGPAGRYGRVTGGLFQNDTAIGVSGFAGVVFSQNFLFSAGRTYSFSISVRNNGPVAHLLPSFSVTLGSGQIILPAASVPKSGEWIQRVASFTVAQTGNQTISIMSHQDRGSGSGTDGGNDYQIDNITVTRRP
uniref:hypothetical protein n=1 Tax=Pseudomonas sp. MWU16-30322 TaxID=2878092 RepID=UPI001CFB044A